MIQQVDPRDWERLTPAQRGLHRALLLHRYSDPRGWRQQVDAIEDTAERAVADDYLRGILVRMKAAVAARKASGAAR